MRTVLQDARYAVRILTRSPATAAIAIVTLALGIGANTAIFSAADSLLWRSVPIPEPGRVVMVMERTVQMQSGWIPAGPANLRDWRAQSRSFSSLAAYQSGSVNLTASMGAPGEPERLASCNASPEIFDVAGVRPAIGRVFTAEDRDVVVVSHSLWQRRFGGDRSLVGKSLMLDGRAVQVIGILPERFDFLPDRTDLYLPLLLPPQLANLRSAKALFGIGRLAPGVSLPQARAEMDAIAVRLAEQFPDTNREWRVAMIPLHEFLMGGLASQYALLLLAVAGFVVLMACANVANLQFARASGRTREIAVRAALGASRGRILGQLLTESIVLAAAGGAAGMLVAAWGIDLIRSAMGGGLVEAMARFGGLQLDGRTLVFTLLCALAAGVLSGLAPALGLLRPNLANALRESGRNTAGRRAHRFRGLLVAAQLAVSLVLLIGAGLMVKGFRSLIDREQSLDPAHVLTMRLSLPRALYPRPADVVGFYDRLLPRVQSLPGVESAALANAIPHSGYLSALAPFFREGVTPPAPGEQRIAVIAAVSPQYFRAARVPILSGRALAPRDTAGALISRSMAERYWPGEDPVGKRVRLAADAPWLTIAGVAGDVVYNSYDREPRPALYVPLGQSPERAIHVLVRTSRDAASLAQAVQAEIHQVDPAQPVFQVATLDRLIRDHLAGTRSVGAMMASLSLLALVLASIGVYGVMSWLVTERTHEIGLRIAMGAPRKHVLSLVLKRGLWVTAAGLAAGTAAAWALARLLRDMIFGVAPTDPVIFVSVPAVLLAVTFFAAWLPARRATRVDPMAALRYD
jgi:putative ABC transport system permease protein